MPISLKKFLCVITLFLIVSNFALSDGRPSLITNTLEEIDACQGKLELKLIRIWGGSQEEDENKFFESPESVAIDNNGNVYICDQYGNCIKEFTASGEYVKTIGRRGKGPGDLLTPHSLTLCPNGDLVVQEMMGRRIQRFDKKGNSKKIIKSDVFAYWIGVTPQDELVVYDKRHTFASRKLLSVMDSNGKKLREIGQYHDNAKNLFKSEGLQFAIDCDNNFYAANNWTPVIRKYSSSGKLLMAITFEVPFDIQFKITLDEQRREIMMERMGNAPQSIKIERTKRKATTKFSSGNGKPRPVVNQKIATDSQKRIFVVSSLREFTEEELEGLAGVIISGDQIIRKGINFKIAENLTVYKLLVFSPEGKIIATAPLASSCGQIYIHGNRLFIVDGFYNQRILEYEMAFKK